MLWGGYSAALRMDEKNPITPFGTGDGAGQCVGPGNIQAGGLREQDAGRHQLSIVLGATGNQLASVKAESDRIISVRRWNAPVRAVRTGELSA
jgi:hypothetical protein